MSKIDDYLGELRARLFLEDSELRAYLLSQSGLPGPRGNLELAAAFARLVVESEDAEEHWGMLQEWLALDAHVAPVNDPLEFLAFCAVLTLGALYGRLPAKRAEIVAQVQSSAEDARWRIREAVAMSLQRIGEYDADTLCTLLSSWLEEASTLQQRAILAALAHTPFMVDEDLARLGLQMTETILRRTLALSKADRKGDAFRALKKGLSYAPSLFVRRLPEEGFALLRCWALVDDSDIGRIVLENLKKKRLRNYETQIAQIKELIAPAATRR